MFRQEQKAYDTDEKSLALLIITWPFPGSDPVLKLTSKDTQKQSQWELRVWAVPIQHSINDQASARASQ